MSSILVVEDNTISLKALEGLLAARGFQTVSAKTGRQALEQLARSSDIALIISDLMMPEMDGLQLLEALGKHAAWKTIPVIILTALADADTVHRIAALGARNYLIKPVREETLLPKVRQLLEETGSDGRALRAKHRVMDELGIGLVQYDRMFRVFREQLDAVLGELTKAMGGSAVPDPPRQGEIRSQLLKLGSGARVLGAQGLLELLRSLRGEGEADWAGIVVETRRILDEMRIDERDRGVVSSAFPRDPGGGAAPEA